MLGISVYFKAFDETYLKKATQQGVQFVFTSLHIPEEDFVDIQTKIKRLLSLCQKENLLLVPDISPVTFQKLGLAKGDFTSLRTMGFKALRLDWGFNDLKLIKDLQRDFTLFLNASVLDRDFITRAKAEGIDLSQIHAAHNFYPQVDTGLSETYFQGLNDQYRDTPVQILAFVPGDQLKRFPFYTGLPTLEHQRGKNPYVSAVSLIHHFGVQDIAIGDSQAKLETLGYIKQYLSEKIITLPVIINSGAEDTLFGQTLAVRRDLSANVIRLRTSRLPEVAIAQTGERPRGTITQANRLAGRYSGELQISKSTLAFNREMNILGYIHPEYLDLLAEIDGHTKLRFVSV